MGQCPIDIALKNEYTIYSRGNVYGRGGSRAAALPGVGTGPIRFLGPQGFCCSGRITRERCQYG